MENSRLKIVQPKILVRIWGPKCTNEETVYFKNADPHLCLSGVHVGQLVACFSSMCQGKGKGLTNLNSSTFFISLTLQKWFVTCTRKAAEREENFFNVYDTMQLYLSPRAHGAAKHQNARE